MGRFGRAMKHSVSERPRDTMEGSSSGGTPFGRQWRNDDSESRATGLFTRGRGGGSRGGHGRGDWRGGHGRGGGRGGYVQGAAAAGGGGVRGGHVQGAATGGRGGHGREGATAGRVHGRSFNGNESGFGSAGRAASGYGGNESARSYGGNEGARGYGGNESARSYGGRGGSDFNSSGNGGARSYGGNGGYGGNEGARSYGGRGGSGHASGFNRNERGGFNRNEYGQASFNRNERGSFNRNEHGRGHTSGFNRNEYGQASGFNRNERGGFNGNEHGGSSGYDRGGRGGRGRGSGGRNAEMGGTWGWRELESFGNRSVFNARETSDGGRDARQGHRLRSGGASSYKPYPQRGGAQANRQALGSGRMSSIGNGARPQIKSDNITQEIESAVRSRDTVNFNLLIAQFGKQRLFRAVLQTWDALRESNTRASLITYSSLINACIRCGELEKAKSFHKEMLAARIKPNEITYTTLIKGFCQEGLINEAIALYAEMKSHRVTPNIRTFNTLLRGCLRTGHVEHARLVFEDVRNATTVSQQSSKAKQRSDHREEELSATAYGYYVKTLCQVLQVQEAWEVANEMKQQNQHYSPAFSALATACALLGDVQGAKKAIMEAKQMAEAEKSSLPMLSGNTKASLPLFLKLRMDEVLRDIASVSDYLAKIGTKKPKPPRFGQFPNSSRVIFFNNPQQQVVDNKKKKKKKKKEGKKQQEMKDEEKGQLQPVQLEKPTVERLNFAQLFGNSNPVKLELCSGHGDWAVERAKTDIESNWIAAELRFERVFLIWSKLIFNQIDNLLILGGDVVGIIGQSFHPSSVDEVYVNYPEPPARQDSKTYLFDSAFFLNLHTLLKDNGTFTIVTDNDSVCKLVISELDNIENTIRFKSALADDKKFDKVVPDDYGTSYFDRFWTNANMTKRYFIKYKKITPTTRMIEDVNIKQLETVKTKAKTTKQATMKQDRKEKQPDKMLEEEIQEQGREESDTEDETQYEHNQDNETGEEQEDGDESDNGEQDGSETEQQIQEEKMEESDEDQE